MRRKQIKSFAPLKKKLCELKRIRNDKTKKQLYILTNNFVVLIRRMAFRFINNNKSSSSFYPTWLRDNSNLKQLPGVYQGVLGQVQLQPNFDGESRFVDGQILARRQQQLDYMNRFTDTQRVHQLLSASKLNNKILSGIWAHVNKTFPGKLTNREVCLALALIALFQKSELDCTDDGSDRKKSTNYGNKINSTHRDPFILIKFEKKPPVPTLYPSHSDLDNRVPKSQITTSKSMPDELSAQDLLVDICSDNSTNNTNGNSFSKKEHNLLETYETNDKCDKDGFDHQNRDKLKGNLISLIDMDSDRFEISFYQLSQIWFRFLSAMKIVFRQSYSILNVEYGRENSILALSSPQGIEFMKNLSICYPLAHNIKFKIDELKNLETFSLLDKSYINQIEDLMNSIKEYWAVLINLFHESGQIEFIELIMDGLNYKTPTVTSKTLDELVNEMNSVGKTDLCSICQTKFYLLSCNTSTSNMSANDVSVLTDSQLITLDNQYYYHARCANFWLNRVDSSGLPFHREPDAILSPAIKDNLDVFGL